MTHAIEQCDAQGSGKTIHALWIICFLDINDKPLLQSAADYTAIALKLTEVTDFGSYMFYIECSSQELKYLLPFNAYDPNSHDPMHNLSAH